MCPSIITHVWRWIIHFSMNIYWSLPCGRHFARLYDTHQKIYISLALRSQLYIYISFQWGRIKHALVWPWVLGSQRGHSGRGVESEGTQRTSWGGETGTVSLQIKKQDIKLESVLCEVSHTIHSPGLPASSKVAQRTKAEFLNLSVTDNSVLPDNSVFRECYPVHIIERSAASLTSIY